MNLKKLHTNVYVGAAIAIFTTFMMLEANNIALKNVESATFPRLVLWAMYIVAAWLLVTGFFSSEEVEWKTEKQDLIRVCLMFGGMIVFGLIFQVLGYIVANMFLLGCGLLLFGHKNKKTVLIVTILVPIIMFFSFTALKVRLPRLF